MLETLQSIGNFISCTERERERDGTDGTDGAAIVNKHKIKSKG